MGLAKKVEEDDEKREQTSRVTSMAGVPLRNHTPGVIANAGLFLLRSTAPRWSR